MLIYLAGGINGLGDTLARDWRAYATTRLVACGHAVRDPMSRDYRGIEAAHVDEIVHGDLKDIDECGALLAMCRTPSWGTGMEIRYAWQNAKPVIAVVGLDNVNVSPWLAFHTKHIFATLGQAVDWFCER